MADKRSVLQKISVISAVISFVLAIASSIMLYLRLESLGGDHPITASFMASTFFFVCVGVVLLITGTADLPNFKIDNTEDK